MTILEALRANETSAVSCNGYTWAPGKLIEQSKSTGTGVLVLWSNVLGEWTLFEKPHPLRPHAGGEVVSDENEFTMSRFLTQKDLSDAMRKRIEEQQKRIAELEAALRSIIAEDYRGNEPSSIRIAREALRDHE